MIVKSVILAAMLSQPVVTPNMIDMTYKPCAELYYKYVDLYKQDIVRGAILGDKLVVLCKPIEYEMNKEQ